MFLSFPNPGPPLPFIRSLHLVPSTLSKALLLSPPFPLYTISSFSSPFCLTFTIFRESNVLLLQLLSSSHPSLPSTSLPSSSFPLFTYFVLPILPPVFDSDLSSAFSPPKPFLLSSPTQFSIPSISLAHLYFSILSSPTLSQLFPLSPFLVPSPFCVHLASSHYSQLSTFHPGLSCPLAPGLPWRPSPTSVLLFPFPFLLSPFL